MLYNLAALYWRIQGNHHQGLECIRRALFFCPDEYKDVPLLNLANILYKLGRVDDAITVTNDALIVNDLEVGLCCSFVVNFPSFDISQKPISSLETCWLRK